MHTLIKERSWRVLEMKSCLGLLQNGDGKVSKEEKRFNKYFL